MNVSSARSVAIRHVLQYSSSQAVLQAAAMLQHFVMAISLGPTVFGTYNTVLLILSYSAVLQFGLVDGLRREVPILRGQGRDADASALKETGLTASLLVGTAGMAVLFAAVPFLSDSTDVRIGLAMASLIVFTGQLTDYFGGVFRAENRFESVSAVNLLGSLSRLLGVPLIFLLGLYGAYMALLLIHLLGFAYSWYSARHLVSFTLRLDRKMLYTIVGAGVPLYLIGCVETITTTLDRWLILTFLDVTQLGFYTAPKAFSAIPGILIGMAVNSVLYTRVGEEFGRSGSIASLEPTVMKTLRVLSVLVPILGGALYLVIPTAVAVLMPEYAAGIAAAQALTLSVCLMTVFGTLNGVFAMAGRLGTLVKAHAATIASGAIAAYALILLGAGVTGVAWAKVASVTVFVLVLFWAFLHEAGHSLAARLRISAALLWPSVVCFGGALIVVYAFTPYAAASLSGQVAGVAAQLLVFAIGCYVVLGARLRMVVRALFGDANGEITDDGGGQMLRLLRLVRMA